jgi:hypothetical protein
MPAAAGRPRSGRPTETINTTLARKCTWQAA